MVASRLPWSFSRACFACLAARGATQVVCTGHTLLHFHVVPAIHWVVSKLTLSPFLDRRRVVSPPASCGLHDGAACRSPSHGSRGTLWRQARTMEAGELTWKPMHGEYVSHTWSREAHFGAKLAVAGRKTYSTCFSQQRGFRVAQDSSCDLIG